jgi:hypothetical protein
MDLIIQYIREKLQILINMDRIDLTMFTGNIGPYIVIAVYFFTAKMLANIIKSMYRIWKLQRYQGNVQ